MFSPVVLATVVPDEDGQRSDDDECQCLLARKLLQHHLSKPLRQRAMAQLRPVSIPEIVRDKRWLLIAFGTPESNPKLLATMKVLAWGLN